MLITCVEYDPEFDARQAERKARAAMAPPAVTASSQVSDGKILIIAVHISHVIVRLAVLDFKVPQERPEINDMSKELLVV